MPAAAKTLSHRECKLVLFLKITFFLKVLKPPLLQSEHFTDGHCDLLLTVVLQLM